MAGGTFVVGEEGSSWQRGFEQALPCEAATRPASKEVSIGRISETEKWVVWEKNLRVLFGARLNFSFSDASRPPTFLRELSSPVLRWHLESGDATRRSLTECPVNDLLLS